MSSVNSNEPIDRPPPLWLQVVFIAITLLIIMAVLFGPLLVAVFMKNPVYLGAFLGGSISLTLFWNPIIKWIFPKRKVEMDFELEKLRIKNDAKSQKKK